MHSLMSLVKSALLCGVFILAESHAANFNNAWAQKASGKGPTKDRVCVGGEHNFPCFGLFDGNGGTKAASLAQAKLCKYLYRSCTENTEIPDCCDDNIRKAFEKVGQKTLFLKDDSGSTALMVFFSAVDGQLVLHVAHIGDSTAILKNGDKLQILTTYHRPTNPEEIIRINKAKGIKRKLSDKEPSSGSTRPSKFYCSEEIRKKLVFDNVDKPRGLVFGKNISTLDENKENSCISSKCKKIKAETWEENLNITRCFGHGRFLSEGLSYLPEIKHIPLNNSPGFVILYSDGVGDYISAQDAASLVARQLAEGIKLDIIAKNLIIKAAKAQGNSEDDYDNPYKFKLKDDMTVLIVRWGETACAE